MSLSQPNLLDCKIFLHESSSRTSLVRIEWLVSVFEDHLLNFENIADVDGYKSNPASVGCTRSSTHKHTLIRRLVFLQVAVAH